MTWANSAIWLLNNPKRCTNWLRFWANGYATCRHNARVLQPQGSRSRGLMSEDLMEIVRKQRFLLTP